MRLSTVAMSFVLVASSLGQIGPASDGSGYLVSVGAWLQPGQSVEYDLDGLAFDVTNLYFGPSPRFLLGRGMGRVVLQGEGEHRYIRHTWKIPRLPDEWRSTIEMRTMVPTLRDGLWREETTTSPLLFPMDKVDPPRLQTGQAFTVVPGQKPPLKGADGNPVPLAKLVYRRFRLVSFSGDGYRFRLDGSNEEIRLTSPKPLLEREDIEPLAGDENADRLASAEIGQNRWAYSGTIPGEGLDGELEKTFRLGAHPVKVRAVYRFWRSRGVMLAQPSGNNWGGGIDNAWRTAIHPLVVVLDPPPEAKPVSGIEIFNGLMTEKEMAAETRRRMEPQRYQAFALYAADIWHFRRLLSETPPEKDFAGATPAIRKAFAAGQLARGMTYRQVAWLIGWPDIAASTEMLVARKLVSWPYPAVIFEDEAVFRNGRFQGYAIARLP